MPGTGGMLRALEAASGRKATVLGKPHPPMIEVVLNRCGGALDADDGRVVRTYCIVMK